MALCTRSDMQHGVEPNSGMQQHCMALRLGPGVQGQQGAGGLSLCLPFIWSMGQEGCVPLV